ncbi:solute carrier family 15, member 5 [Corchorus olitorius]|uniref:Solute carrier family 15, member 5 n=1 Tax=Corchorus olitorius TaxID=93759 RepID=A0A1R3I4F9_9ROSI|nr:solute carrier family 15, member 5 [Corchorus olitorius]
MEYCATKKCKILMCTCGVSWNTQKDLAFQFAREVGNWSESAKAINKDGASQDRELHGQISTLSFTSTKLYSK